jgi:hypothetical protein
MIAVVNQKRKKIKGSIKKGKKRKINILVKVVVIMKAVIAV